MIIELLWIHAQNSQLDNKIFDKSLDGLMHETCKGTAQGCAKNN